MQMSFLFSIGDSGLQELLELVFAGNAIRHNVNCNTISRAVCGHMLIDAAMINILYSKVYHIPLPTKDTGDPKRDTASTDSKIDEDEIQYRPTCPQQGTVDVTSDITEAN